jgi:Zn-dependent oligopeptidase
LEADALIHVPPDQLRISRTDAEMDTLADPLTFYQNVSTSGELRDAAKDAQVLLNEYGIEISMRFDVYQAKLNAAKNIKTSGRKLNAEEERLVEKLLLDGKRAGLDLPDEERKELEKLKKELSQVCVEFKVSYPLEFAESINPDRNEQKNFNEENVCFLECQVIQHDSQGQSI